MTKRAPKAPKPNASADPSNTVQMPKGVDPADRPRLIAKLAVTPSLQGASTIKRWSHVVGDLDITGLINELRQQAATASTGDLRRQEAILAIQAHTLDNDIQRTGSPILGQHGPVYGGGRAVHAAGIEGPEPVPRNH